MTGLVHTADGTDSTERERRWSPLALVAFAALVAVVTVGLTVELYYASIHAAAGNADGASIVLVGKSLASPDIFLRHWALSLDSFWLVDAPFYAVAVSIVGIKPQLIHAVPAVLAALCVVVGAFVASRDRSRPAAILGAFTVVVLLALPARIFAGFFVMGPLHVGTTLWCLLAMLAVRRARFGTGFVLATVLLAAGLLGDLQAAALGIAPIALAGITRMIRTRQVHSGLPAFLAAVTSVALAAVVRGIAILFGTFSIAAANPIASLHQMKLNLGHIPSYLVGLAGASSKPFGAPVGGRPVEVIHAVGAAFELVALVLAVIGLVAGMVRGSKARHLAARRSGEDSFLDDAVLFGFVGSCAVFVGLSFTTLSAFGRYLTPALIYAAVMAGRMLGRLFQALEGHFVVAILVGALCFCVAGAYAASFAKTLSPATPRQVATKLASYLEAHHLTHGIGAYWSSSIVTVESGGKVVVRPVETIPGTPHVSRYMRESTSDWYRRGFNFLVYEPAAPWGGIDTKTATASFGPPSEVADVGPYRVLIWDHEIAVASNGTWPPRRVPTG